MGGRPFRSLASPLPVVDGGVPALELAAWEFLVETNFAH